MIFEIESNNEYWYQLLNCLPVSSNSIEYKRLKRVWADQTRFKGTKGTTNRKHTLFNLTSEQNLQISLWENFSIFNKEKFILKLIKLANLDFPIQSVTNVSWSYEWEKPIYKNEYRIGIKLIDIVLKITTNKSEYLIVIECKNLTSKLAEKDLSPSYYLDNIEEFDRFGTNKSILYCIGERAEKAVKEQVKQLKNNVGIITWESLAILQLDLVIDLEVNETIKKFISYSLIKQFQNKGIKTNGYHIIDNKTSSQINIPFDSLLIDLDNNLIDIVNLDFIDIIKMDIEDNIKGFICGALLNQFPIASRKTLPFEYLNYELKQSEIDKTEYQSRQERELQIWDL